MWVLPRSLDRIESRNRGRAYIVGSHGNSSRISGARGGADSGAVTVDTKRVPAPGMSGGVARLGGLRGARERRGRGRPARRGYSGSVSALAAVCHKDSAFRVTCAKEGYCPSRFAQPERLVVLSPGQRPGGPLEILALV
ncbi:hypothetical protein FRUB_02788 [Fimbriiglobus ruber]|uniref:Uncharacterized protein n=1 Tax=Fimbriiglobus ruber TaxID=1908690 RepID=A0A225E128_9BACT|nr:hypothetical protein FRUB_02788 [Fimbriiglobus ruber]